MSKHAREAQRQDTIQQARRQWMQERIENIHRHVTAYDVLLRGGVSLKGGDREEQFSCPFHGVDRRPSARVYPDSPSSPSHAWCFKCQERWDAIALWRKFNQLDDAPFGQVLASIEQAYALDAPPFPEDGYTPPDEEEDEDYQEYEMLLDVCERRLKECRPAYQKLGDMLGFLNASTILDRVSYRVQRKTLRPDKAVKVLRELLDRIGAKVRSAPTEEAPWPAE